MSRNNDDVVMIELDRLRELRYGHKALKRLVAITGKSLEDIENGGLDDLDMVEKMVYCGLLSDAKENNETLKLEDMEDLLDSAPNYAHIINAVQTAFMAAFGAKPDEMGNQPEPVQEPVSAKNSTSTKADE